MEIYHLHNKCRHIVLKSLIDRLRSRSVGYTADVKPESIYKITIASDRKEKRLV